MNPITTEDLKREPLQTMVFKMKTTNEKNMHKQYATYMVDTLLAKMQPYFQNKLEGTLLTGDYVHAARSFTYIAPTAIVKAMATHITEAIVCEHEDGSFYELTYDPNAVIEAKMKIEREQLMYAWIKTPPGLAVGVEQLSGPLAGFLSKMGLDLDTRIGALTQTIDKTNDTKLPRFRCQFTENGNFAPFKLMRYSSGDFTINDHTIEIVIGKEYMEGHRIHAICRRWTMTDKEVKDRATPRQLVCQCNTGKKVEGKPWQEKKADDMANRKRKAAHAAAGPSRNPFADMRE